MPSDGIFTVHNPQDTSISFPPSWNEFFGENKLVGNWTNALAKEIAKFNPYCTLIFKGNHVSRMNSRKKKSPFVNGYAICAHQPQCSGRVNFIVKKDDTSRMHFTFEGKIKHDLRAPKSRRIAGNSRAEMKDVFEKNIHLPPSDAYRSKLANISGPAFAAGNRTGAGKSLKVSQQIKNENRKDHRDLQPLHAKIAKLQEEIRHEDQETAKDLKQFNRKLYGYIHMLQLVPDLKIVLLHESLIRLYHGIAPRDIVYFDATGSVVQKMSCYKRILYYALCVRHPFGKTPPLPVAEFISSSHSTESICRGLMLLREKEKQIYSGKFSYPALVLVDNSLAMILACLQAFNNETLPKYVDRTFRIVRGKATEEDLKLTLIHVCYSHSMKWNKTMIEKLVQTRLSKQNREVSNFFMYYFARLIESRRLDELSNLVKYGAVILKSKYLSQDVVKAVKAIESSINEYPHVTENVNEFNDAEDEGDTSAANDWGKGEGINDNEHAEEVLQEMEASSLAKYWENELEKVEASIAVPQKLEQLQLNRYYNPKYYDYLRNRKLPTATLWTNLCLGDLTRFNQQYECRTEAYQAAKNTSLQNKTSGQIEGLFSTLKRNSSLLKAPLDHFINRLWENLKGLRRQFVDGLWVGAKSREKCSLPRATLNSLKKQFTAEETGESPDQQRNCQLPVEESWNKTTVRKRDELGQGYYRPGQRAVFFNQNLDVEKKSNKRSNSYRYKKAFVKFRDTEWPNEAAQSPTVAECIDRIRRRWKGLSEAKQYQLLEKEDIEPNTDAPCSCGLTWEQEASDMIMCDICKVWYHNHCEGIEESYAAAATFYHCQECVLGNFFPFIRYCAQNLDYIDMEKGSEDVVAELYGTWKKKGVAEQSLINELEFPDIEIRNGSRNQAYSTRGIENPYQTTCWMNAVLQVLCGSCIFDLLPSDESISVLRKLKSIHEELISDGPSSALNLSNSMRSLAEEVKYPISRCQQFDSLEYVQAIIATISSNCTDDQFSGMFSSTYAKLLMCRLCPALKGEVFTSSSYMIRVPDWEEELSLTSLLWDTAACQYSIEEQGPGCDCGRTATGTGALKKDPSLTNKSNDSPTQGTYYYLNVMLNAPTVLLIETNRVCGSMAAGRINRTPIRVEETLDVKICASRSNNKSIKYQLVGAVNLLARSQYQGHNYATIFDDKGIATTFDDSNVSKATSKAKLCSSAFAKSTYLLFYVHSEYFAAHKRPEETNRIIPWTLDSLQRKRVQRFWLGTDRFLLNTPRVSEEDVLKVAGKNWMNDVGVRACIDLFCRETSEIRVETTSTYLMEDLATGRASKEVHNILLDGDWLKKDLILVPIHERTARGENLHWSVAGIYPKLKIMLHCDSLHRIHPEVFSTLMSVIKQWSIKYNVPYRYGDWTFVSSNEIARQSNNYDCGPYTCLNAFAMLRQRLWLPTPADSSAIRYWIAYKVLCVPNVQGKHTKVGITIPVETAMVQRTDIKRSLSDIFPSATGDIFEYLHDQIHGKKTCGKMYDGLESSYSYDAAKYSNIEDPITPGDEILPDEVDDRKGAQDRYSSKCLFDDSFAEVDEMSNDGHQRQATPIDNDRVVIISDKTSDADVVISSDNESAPDVSVGSNSWSGNSDSSAESEKMEMLDDDDEFACSFRSNKEKLLESIKNAKRNFDEGRLSSERLAAALTSKSMFISKAQQEAQLLAKEIGKDRYDKCLNFVEFRLFSHYREPTGELFDYGGIVKEPLPYNFALTRTNLFTFIVLPELLTLYFMDKKKCNYSKATRCLCNSEQQCVTAFHMGLLLRVRY